MAGQDRVKDAATGPLINLDMPGSFKRTKRALNGPLTKACAFDKPQSALWGGAHCQPGLPRKVRIIVITRGIGEHEKDHLLCRRHRQGHHEIDKRVAHGNGPKRLASTTGIRRECVGPFWVVCQSMSLKGFASCKPVGVTKPPSQGVPDCALNGGLRHIHPGRIGERHLHPRILMACLTAGCRSPGWRHHRGFVGCGGQRGWGQNASGLR